MVADERASPGRCLYWPKQLWSRRQCLVAVDTFPRRVHVLTAVTSFMRFPWRRCQMGWLLVLGQARTQLQCT